MKVLYIGQYQNGSTSRMRAEALKSILDTEFFDVINITIPFNRHKRFVRSIGFRYKKGPVIRSVNKYLIDGIGNSKYDLIWVDKAVFLTEQTTKVLREASLKLIHFTPDCAFYENRSRHFENSLKYYDVVVTTKSFETGFYNHRLKKNQKIILTTQGFDAKVHRRYITSFKHKKDCICFIGLYEEHRREVIQLLLNNGLSVRLGGVGWENFVKMNKSKDIEYLGKRVLGNSYAKAISESKFAWGALSRKFPELHTTRTFEIPACGTVLITERNEETELFYSHNEVVFYTKPSDLVGRILQFQQNQYELEALAERGYQKVKSAGFDNQSIMKRLILEIFS